MPPTTTLTPAQRALRLIVPILLIVGGVFVGWAVYTNSEAKKAPSQVRSESGTKGSTSSTSTPESSPTTTQTVTAEGSPAAASQPSPPSNSVPTTTPSTPNPVPGSSFPTPASKLVAVSAGPISSGAGVGGLAPIGSTDPASVYRMEVRFSPLGAGVASIDLAGVYKTVERTEPERLQGFIPHPTIPNFGVVPFALDGVEIEGNFVPLFKSGTDTVWKQIAATTGSTTFEAVIEDQSVTPPVTVAKVTRTYTLEPSSYDLILEQRVVNATPQMMSVVWRMWGPADLDKGFVRTGGDYRRVRFGYLSSAAVDPTQGIVRAEKFVDSRDHWLGEPARRDPSSGLRLWDPKTIWPNPTSEKRGFTPVWVGTTNRYFAVSLHTRVDAQSPAAATGKRLLLAGTVERYVMDHGAAAGAGGGSESTETLMTYLRSVPVSIGVGGTGNFDAAVYAGPLAPSLMREKVEPRAAAVSMKEIVVYTMGGPCWWCTFQWLTHPLQWFLTFLHDNIVFDYAIAIMVLVVCVRTLLHPVTKWSQISMLRFSKQMAALAPKQKKIQEKYKDDPVRMRQEIATLMREENISYKGLLGCLPAFLQSPIWIALYAMLYFMYGLRHEPAFFGAVQSVAGSWKFLADLSEPDHFIPLGAGIHIPIMGLVDSVNVLPILLGVVFYVQQKYMTPPPTTQLTPEQEQQQKIVKVMMVVLFPLMMYNTPSALVLYFIVNSTLGTLESRYIRNHVTAKDLEAASKPEVIDRYNPAGRGKGKTGGGNAGAKPGFFARLQQLAEERAKQIEEAKRRQGRK